MIKYARCAKCRHFYLNDRLVKDDCPSCTYTTYRCNTCGGDAGARRSIMAHFSWYRSRGQEAGGHSRSVSPPKSKSKTKVVKIARHKNVAVITAKVRKRAA